MTNAPINVDWDRTWAEFWEKMGKNAPSTKIATEHITQMVKYIWKEAKPFAGIEEKIEISVDREYNLKTSMSGWVLLGAIAITATNLALEEIDKSPHFQELSKKISKLEKELQDIKEKVKNITEYKEIA